MPFLRVTLALLTCLPAIAGAELRWEQPIQDFQRSPEDKYVEARFAFKNVGSSPVTIRRTRSSCGCTTAKLAKQTYVPGESGEIVAKFNFGSRTGPQRKTITVFTEGKEAPDVVLDLRVDVQQPFVVSPGLVFWRIGDEPVAKLIQLTSANGRKVRVKSVTSTNPRVQAKLQTAEEGERYTVLVTPAATDRKETAELRVETDYPADAPRTYTIYARIK